MGEGGVPPLSVKFFFVKNRPKNSVFWAKNAVFGGKFVEFRPLWGGGGGPPHSVNFFPLVFRRKIHPLWGGGNPPSGQIQGLGFLNRSLRRSSLSAASPFLMYANPTMSPELTFTRLCFLYRLESNFDILYLEKMQPSVQLYLIRQ